MSVGSHGKHGDRYDRYRDSLARKRQLAYFEGQHPDLYARWLALPSRKERRKMAALARRGAL